MNISQKPVILSNDNDIENREHFSEPTTIVINANSTNLQQSNISNIRT